MLTKELSNLKEEEEAAEVSSEKQSS